MIRNPTLYQPKIINVILLVAIRNGQVLKNPQVLDKESIKLLFEQDLDGESSDSQDILDSENRKLDSTGDTVGFNVTTVENGTDSGFSYTPDQLRKAQESDSDLTLIRFWLENKRNSEENVLQLASPATKKYFINKEHFFLDENNLMWNISKQDQKD